MSTPKFIDPDYEKKFFINKFMDNNILLDSASEDEKRQYYEYVEEGCAKMWPIALEAKAYACYGGNSVYPCDWYASRDCLLKLIDLVGDENIFAYNTLGYIYYYGRCNDGVPEYDMAFKYFSIGAANGVYESMYKLADMFAGGKGVPKSLAAAAKIITGMYDENHDIFCNGDYSGKFADVALRMGALYEHGDGVDVEIEKAYHFYLQARYAIDKRIANYDYYGDMEVCKKIDDAIERVSKLLPEDFIKKNQTFQTPALLGIMLAESAGLDIELYIENGEYCLRVTRLASETMLNNILITLPQINYCEFTNEVILHVNGISNISTEELPFKAFITSIRHGDERLMWEFCCRDRVMLSFCCEEFVFSPY